MESYKDILNERRSVIVSVTGKRVVGGKDDALDDGDTIGDDSTAEDEVEVEVDGTLGSRIDGDAGYDAIVGDGDSIGDDSTAEDEVGVVEGGTTPVEPETKSLKEDEAGPKTIEEKVQEVSKKRRTRK